MLVLSCILGIGGHGACQVACRPRWCASSISSSGTTGNQVPPVCRCMAGVSGPESCPLTVRDLGTRRPPGGRGRCRAPPRGPALAGPPAISSRRQNWSKSPTLPTGAMVGRTQTMPQPPGGTAIAGGARGCAPDRQPRRVLNELLHCHLQPGLWGQLLEDVPA